MVNYIHNRDEPIIIKIKNCVLKKVNIVYLITN